eukprot:m51a1_g10514 hypothetical protein (124) ;mRNA; f:193669-194040
MNNGAGEAKQQQQQPAAQQAQKPVLMRRRTGALGLLERALPGRSSKGASLIQLRPQRPSGFELVNGLALSGRMPVAPAESPTHRRHLSASGSERVAPTALTQMSEELSRMRRREARAAGAAHP